MTELIFGRNGLLDDKQQVAVDNRMMHLHCLQLYWWRCWWPGPRPDVTPTCQPSHPPHLLPLCIPTFSTHFFWLPLSGSASKEPVVRRHVQQYNLGCFFFFLLFAALVWLCWTLLKPRFHHTWAEGAPRPEACVSPQVPRLRDLGPAIGRFCIRTGLWLGPRPCCVSNVSSHFFAMILFFSSWHFSFRCFEARFEPQNLNLLWTSPCFWHTCQRCKATSHSDWNIISQTELEPDLSLKHKQTSETHLWVSNLLHRLRIFNGFLMQYNCVMSSNSSFVAL